MPWSLPEDLARFRELTSGGPVLMGRRTWDALPERFRPLPDRRNLVLTRDPAWAAPGAEAVHSLEEGLAALDPRGWVIGGGELYRAALPFADVLEVTEIDLDEPGDTFAPELDAASWAADRGPWQRSRTGVRYRFVRHERTVGA